MNGARPDRSELHARMREVLSACLRDGAEILRRFFGAMREGDVVAKSRDFDLQTVADVQAERAIAARILAAFPEHAILSEDWVLPTSPGAYVAVALRACELRCWRKH